MAGKGRPEKLTTKKEQDDFITSLKQHQGVKERACHDCDVSNETVRKRMQSDDNFRERVIEVIDLRNDRFIKTGRYMRMEIIEQELKLLWERSIDGKMTKQDHLIFKDYSKMHSELSVELAELATAVTGDIIVKISEVPFQKKYSRDTLEEITDAD